jgi:hypothetical protein
MKEHFQTAGVQKALGTHSLRRGGATEAVNNGADRIVVRKVGRWRNEKVFEMSYVKDDGAAKQRLRCAWAWPTWHSATSDVVGAFKVCWALH